MASTSQLAHAVVEMQPPVSFLPAPAAALVHWLLTLSIGCLLNSLAHTTLGERELEVQTLLDKTQMVSLLHTQPLERGNWRWRHCLDKTQMVWHQFHTLNFLSLLCSSSHLCCNQEQTFSLYIHGPVMKRSSKWWNKDERTQRAVLLVKSLLFT